MGGAEIRVIEWTSVWDDRSSIEVRDGDRYQERGDIKRKGKESAGEEQMGEVEDMYEGEWWRERTAERSGKG